MKKVVDGFGKENLFNFRPMLFAAFFLIFGIVFAYYRIFYHASPAWILTLLPFLVAPLIFSAGFWNFLLRLRVALLLCIFFCVGFIAFRGQVVEFQTVAKYAGRISVSGVVENCKEQNGQTCMIIKSLHFGEEEVAGGAIVYLPTYMAKGTRVGDKLLLVGNLTTNLRLQGEYGFLQQEVSRGLYYEMEGVDACIKVGRSNNPFLLVRARLEEVVYEGMDSTSAALTVALLTGDIGGVDRGLMDNMRYGGISHIFAVSGLNIGALFGCCLLLFRKTPLKGASKPLRFALLVGVIFFYSGVCGFSASVMRAAITCAVLYFTRLFGAGNDPLNSLGLAAILILLISPAELMSVGFQLSFLACVGLFLFTKRVGHVFDEIAKLYRSCFPKRYTEEEKKILLNGDTLPKTIGQEVWKWVSLTLSASIAAQLTTMPLLMIHFGRISGWSLLLNFFFVPVMDLLFTVLLAVTTIACLLPVALSGWLLYVPSVVWSTATLIFEIADFSAFAWTGIEVTFGACVCYYGGLLCSTDKLNMPVWLKRGLAIVAWLTFFICLYLCNY